MSDVFVCYALYLPSDEIDERALLQKYGDGKFQFLESFEEGQAKPGVLLERFTIAERPAPPDEALAYFGRGFNPEVAELMRQSKLVVAIYGLGPFDPEHKLLRDLTVCVGRIANELGAFVFDVADSLTFIPPAFQQIRVDEIQRGELSPAQFGVRAYRVEPGLRSVTMGLEKFGQCNLGIANFAEHHMGKIDAMMSLLMQHVIESDVKVGPGPVHLNVANIKNSYERQKIASHITGNGSGLVTLNLTELESQGGDPKVLLGPRFDASAGPDLWREQEALLEDLFGAARETTEGVEFDSIAEAVEAARESAQQLLASNQWDAEGTRLKLAVRLEESREVVWIEVESWNDHKGVGILMSDPKAAGVSSGSQLPFSIDMIMDFQLMQGVDIVAKGGVDALVKAMQG